MVGTEKLDFKIGPTVTLLLGVITYIVTMERNIAVHMKAHQLKWSSVIWSMFWF